MRKYEQVGVAVPETLLPRAGVDMQKWAVIACDQFTSQPEYWSQVQSMVENSPSTFNLILPEVYLGKPEEQSHLKTIQQNMKDYLEQGILLPTEGFIYIERSVAGKTRKGLLICLDLEQYDFNKGASSLIRATEGTILDRLPPRIKIRENAMLELPHILVLIDDPNRSVIEPLANHKAELTPVYDTDLMLGSGHICGWRIEQPGLEKSIIKGLADLSQAEVFKTKYQLEGELPILLFAVGDGNHSLATAKAIWEKIKVEVGMDHPARYAMVEIENVHDDGLEFEPIHRVLFEVEGDIIATIEQYFGVGASITKVHTEAEMAEAVRLSTSAKQQIGVTTQQGFFVLSLQNPALNLPVGNLQSFLDSFIHTKGAKEIDYVHGQDVAVSLGKKPGNASFLLPAMNKGDLFKTVILDGALPRKTFSMGEAIEKRFYIECRKIK